MCGVAKIIMEGNEMKGMFKLCLSGIMQTDIDEFKNAVYLETGDSTHANLPR